MAFLRKLLKYEKHILRIAFISSFIGLIFMIVATFTPEWTQLKYFLKHPTNDTLFTSYHEHYGIWQYCISSMPFHSGELKGKIKKFCTKSDLLLTDSEYSKKYEEVAKSKGRKTKDNSKGYFTTRAVFAVVSIFMMVLTLIFNAYSIYRPRYTIKRLTAALYLMSAISSFMSIDMFLEVMGFHEKRLKLDGAKHLSISYGYSFTLNCLVFIIYICGCLMFLAFCSKIKLKEGGNRKEEIMAADADAPIVLC